MMSEYRPDFVERWGLVILEHTDREVFLGRWKPVPDHILRHLENFHGKRVTTVPVDPTGAAVQIARPRPSFSAEESADPERIESMALPESLVDMAHRTRNLPPGEELLRRLVTVATELDATDLALWQTGASRWRCAARIQGSIRDVTILEEPAARALIRLFKMYAGLDAIETQQPQDGRVEFPWLEDRTLRVATVGDRHGEALAVRFLDRRPRPLATLGLEPRQIADVLRAATAPAGVILCCGPTGSGKTTTVAAIAEILVRNGRKVVSVEDPVEYRVPGVLQLESTGTGRNYLPAALRQDPDVLWIGEVRHGDHAPVLTEAVLSGHLVLTTVHAEDAAGAVRRLGGLGVPERVLDGQILLTCTQRLQGDPLRLEATLSGVPPWI